MKRLMAALTAVLLTFMFLPAQRVVAAQEEFPSWISFSGVKTKIEEAVKECPEAAFTAAVFSKDGVISTACFGDIDKENNIKATEESVFEWGDISKALIWVSAMQLAEKGLLDLDAEVTEYIPKDFFRNRTYKEPITMRHLMNHQSGFCENTYTFRVDGVEKLGTLAKALSDTEPAQMYKPGEVTAYSNWGAALAAYVVECIAKEPYSDYVKENILKPLSMEHTSLLPGQTDNEWVKEERAKSVSYAMAQDSEGNILPASIGSRYSYNSLYPSGAVTGTLSDLARFSSALVSKENPLFEKEETLSKLLSGSFFYGESDVPAVCHGFWPEEWGYSVRTVGHEGSTDFGVSKLIIDPASGTGAVMLSNHADGCSAFPLIAELLFGEGKNASFAAESEVQGAENLSGRYITARSLGRGILRFSSFSNSAGITDFGNGRFGVSGLFEMSYAGNGLYIVSQGDYIYPASVTTNEKGTKIIHVTSSDFVENPFGGINTIILWIFVMLGLTAVVIVVVKIIMQLLKKFKSYEGSGLIMISELAMFFSMLAAVVSVNLYRNQYGLTKLQGALFGLVQMACFFAAVLSVLSRIWAIKNGAEDDSSLKMRYIVNIGMNGIFGFSVVFLQLFMFWGC